MTDSHEPRTEAGKRLLNLIADMERLSRDGARIAAYVPYIRAIEAEARSSVLDAESVRATRIADPREVRRLAVEALVEAHYETGGLDASEELRWLENHDEAADALLHAMMLKTDRLVRAASPARGGKPGATAPQDDDDLWLGRAFRLQLEGLQPDYRLGFVRLDTGWRSVLLAPDSGQPIAYTDSPTIDGLFVEREPGR